MAFRSARELENGHRRATMKGRCGDEVFYQEEYNNITLNLLDL